MDIDAFDAVRPARRVAHDHPRSPTPEVDLVLPVFDDERDLERLVPTHHEFLSREFPYSFRLTIADNASTDATAVIASGLALEIPEVISVCVTEKGTGRALRQVWATLPARVLAYCDIDLSTDLATLAPLVAVVMSGHSDLAIGTRLAPGSPVVRGAKREVISRCYDLLLRGCVGVRFSDAQCGFKAILADVAAALLPLIEDAGWFFDTEFLVLAERAGLRIHQVPVGWIEDPRSSVDIAAKATVDLRGVVRLAQSAHARTVPLDSSRERFAGAASSGRRSIMRQRLGRFALVGGRAAT
jgi:glycosyltransferase involved in cell wall biosynthesis